MLIWMIVLLPKTVRSCFSYRQSWAFHYSWYSTRQISYFGLMDGNQNYLYDSKTEMIALAILLLSLLWKRPCVRIHCGKIRLLLTPSKRWAIPAFAG